MLHRHGIPLLEGAAAIGTLLCALCGVPALALAFFALCARRNSPADRTKATWASRLALALAAVAIGAHLSPSARHSARNASHACAQ